MAYSEAQSNFIIHTVRSANTPPTVRELLKHLNIPNSEKKIVNKILYDAQKANILESNGGTPPRWRAVSTGNTRDEVSYSQNNMSMESQLLPQQEQRANNMISSQSPEEIIRNRIIDRMQNMTIEQLILIETYISS